MILALALLAAPQAVTPASGHASLLETEPPDRAVLAVAPTRIDLTFNEPVSPLVLTLVLPGGETRPLPDSNTDGATLRIPMPPALPRGTHLLSWRVVSADGHPVGGTIAFSIGEPSAAPQDRARQRADLDRRGAIWIAKLALYLGLLFGCSGAFHSAWIARTPPDARVARWNGFVLSAGLAGATASVGLQGADAYDAPLSHLRDPGLWLQGLGTPQGLTALIAAGAMLAAALALHGPARLNRLFAFTALFGAGAALAASGHASAASPQALMRPMVLVHGAAVAFWLGAMVPLMAALARQDRGRAELAAFSRIIPWAVAALVLSGGILAVVQLRELSTLWTTSYGLILSAKLLLVSLLLGLAALNRSVFTPQIAGGSEAGARGMRRSIGGEISLALAILGLAAGWRFTPPPRALLDAAVAPVRAHIHAGPAMADLRFDAPVRGARTVQITLLDSGFGPLAAQEVVLVLSKPEAGIEGLRRQARHLDETVWRVPDLSLPAGGRWRVRVDILIDDFTRVAVEDEVDLPP